MVSLAIKDDLLPNLIPFVEVIKVTKTKRPETPLGGGVTRRLRFVDEHKLLALLVAHLSISFVLERSHQPDLFLLSIFTFPPTFFSFAQH